MLWIGFTEGNIAARRLVRREGKQDMLAGAIINPRGLEQQPIGRVEKRGKELHRGKLMGQIYKTKGGDKNERSDQKGKGHPCNQTAVACANLPGMLAGQPPLTPGAQDGNGGGHGVI